MTVIEFRRGAWTVNRLADELGIDRRTVAKRLREANVPPIGKRDRFDVYNFATAAPVVLGLFQTSGVLDPDKLPPLERRAYYQSENERLKVLTATNVLLPAMEVEADYAELVKLISQFFDTLPDVLERDVALTAEQVVKVQESCDRVRQQMYEAVMADADDDAQPEATASDTTEGGDE